jgi:hypothetical protein
MVGRRIVFSYTARRWLAVAVLLLGGGAAGTAAASESSGAVPASACPAPGPPYYAYAVHQIRHMCQKPGAALEMGMAATHPSPDVGNWVHGMDRL